MTHKPFRIVVHWPEKALSPNARVGWRRRAKATNNARTVALLKARSWVANNGPVDPDAVFLRYTFHPPHNRFDDDNMIGMMKAYRDGIADALAINDKHFRTGQPCLLPADKANPRVEIELMNPI
jgi:hypothetical protein